MPPPENALIDLLVRVHLSAITDASLVLTSFDDRLLAEIVGDGRPMWSIKRPTEAEPGSVDLAIVRPPVTREMVELLRPGGLAVVASGGPEVVGSVDVAAAERLGLTLVDAADEGGAALRIWRVPTEGWTVPSPLASIRHDELGRAVDRQAARQAAEHAAHGVWYHRYGRARARVADLAGESGRAAYRKLRRRS